MTRETIRGLVLITVLAACFQDQSRPAAEPPADSHATDAASEPETSVVEYDKIEVLATTERHRVGVVERNEARHLRWDRNEDEWERVWESRDLYSATPNVELADFNADGTLDLFWSLEFEELAGAMFVLQTPTGLREVIVDVHHCSAPQLNRTSDGYEIIVRTSGAYFDCRDMDVSICTTHFEVDVPQVYRLHSDTLIPVRPSAESSATLVGHFRAEAARADSLIGSGATLPGSTTRYADVCEPQFSIRLKAIADSLEEAAMMWEAKQR